MFVDQYSSGEAQTEFSKEHLIHGDCLTGMKTLASGSIDLLLTSPPYNLGVRSGGGVRMARNGGRWKGALLANGYASYDDARAPGDYIDWQRECLREMWRLLSNDGAIFYNHKPRIQKGRVELPTDILPPELRDYVRQVVIWNRNSAFNFNGSFFASSHEWLVVIAKPKWRLKHRGASALKDVWSIGHERGNDHPAPFPVELARRVIGSTNAKTVLDPFMGSGTTGIAAALEDRNFVGIELDAGYFETACQRITDFQQYDVETVEAKSVAPLKPIKPQKPIKPIDPAIRPIKPTKPIQPIKRELPKPSAIGTPVVGTSSELVGKHLLKADRQKAYARASKFEVFKTPAPAYKALLDYRPEWFEGRGFDPSAGDGRMVRELIERGHLGPHHVREIRGEESKALAGCGAETWSIGDYLADDYQPPEADFLLTNPPFRRGEEFVKKARKHVRGPICVMNMVNWQTTQKRSQWLRQAGLAYILNMPKRPRWEVEWGTNTNHWDVAWYVFLPDHVGPAQTDWL